VKISLKAILCRSQDQNVFFEKLSRKLMIDREYLENKRNKSIPVRFDEKGGIMDETEVFFNWSGSIGFFGADDIDGGR
jgi:hypothetical protein